MRSRGKASWPSGYLRARQGERGEAVKRGSRGTLLTRWMKRGYREHRMKGGREDGKGGEEEGEGISRKARNRRNRAQGQGVAVLRGRRLRGGWETAGQEEEQAK